MKDMNWNRIHNLIGREIRLVIVIGANPFRTSSISMECIKYKSAEQFIELHTSVLRADLIILSDVSSASNSEKLISKIYQSSHDNGYVYIVSMKNNIPALMLQMRFIKTEIPNVYVKRELSSPKAYGFSYLRRWGDTDFLKNWKMAAEQIMYHMPANFSKSTVRILDVGCLNGYIMESLRRYGIKQIFGNDISYEIAIKHCINKYHLPAITIDNFCENTYPDGFSDMTIAMEVLEHIPPEKTGLFIQQLHRVTSQKGVVLISTSEDWDVDPTHVNCRKRNEWYYLFSKHGLVPKGKQEIFGGFNSFIFRKTSHSIEKRLWNLYHAIFIKRFNS